MHLVDHGRRHIEAALPPAAGAERLLRRWLGRVLTRPALAARWRSARARLAKPVRGTRCRSGLRPLLALAPRRCAGRLGDRPAAGFPGRGRAADAGRAAARLRPAGAGARDQRGDDPAADPAWLRGRRRAGQRLLRRARASPRRGGAGARLGPRQYRCLGARAAAEAGSTRSSSTPRAAARWSRITAFCCATIRATPKRRRGSPRSPATSARSSPSSGCSRREPRSGAAGRLSFRLLAAARPEDRARAEARCSPPPGSLSSTCRKGICAAARPAPTTCCSRSWQRRCATASWPISR